MMGINKALNGEFVSGNYQPSYLMVTVNTELDLNDPDKLPEAEQSTYYHEYLHFLQNITTTFGVLDTWHTYDRLRQLIHYIHHEHKQDEVLTLPLNNKVTEEQNRITRLLVGLKGDAALYKGNNRISSILEGFYEITEIKLVEDIVLDKMFPWTKVYHIDLLVEHPDGWNTTYRFGKTCIGESMVQLAERKHYGVGDELPRYPYKIAQELAQFIYPPLADNGELLFSLCDTALMHPAPGWAFQELLQQMKKDNFIPVKGEEVIDYGMRFYEQKKWPIEKQRNINIEGLRKVIRMLLQNPHFKETLEWFEVVVARGHNLRELRPYFFLEMYREKPFGEAMTEAWINTGGPHCKNKLHKRFIRLPHQMHEIEGLHEKVFPQRLYAIWQLYDFLTKGKIECNLIHICENSEPPIVDDRCKLSPWERTKDQRSCPYAAMWLALRLQDRKFMINGALIET